MNHNKENQKTSLEKAYKVLSKQEDISHKAAKDLIDRGRVSYQNKKLTIGRKLIPIKAVLKVIPQESPQVIFEDSNVLAVNKPPFMQSQEVMKLFDGWGLLHRLDKETSGVLLLIKEQSPFHKEAKNAFKQMQVYKEYVAVVNGIFRDECTLNNPLLVEKGASARVRVLEENTRNPKALSAHTFIQPLEVIGKKTKLKVTIKTGRTHQIRAHLAYMGYPILGDTLYGGNEFFRIMLHAYKISLLGYNLEVLPSLYFDLGES